MLSHSSIKCSVFDGFVGFDRFHHVHSWISLFQMKLHFQLKFLWTSVLWAAYRKLNVLIVLYFNYNVERLVDSGAKGSELQAWYQLFRIDVYKFHFILSNHQQKISLGNCQIAIQLSALNK